VAPDRTPPTLKIYGSPGSPLYTPNALASEPLALGATFKLVGSPPLEFVPVVTDGTIVGFNPAAKIIFPFAGVWKAVVTGVDLAGLPIQQPADYETIADPGIFPQDGFESATGHEIVTSVGTLSMTGASLLTNSSKLLHLERATGQSTLRFTVRLLVSAEHGYPADGYVSAGTIGGTRIDQAISFPAQTIATADVEWKYASSLIEGSLLLDDPGVDVVVDFRPPSVTPGPASCVSAENLHCFTRAALLIDDVRLE
jgi:hypothetical protein